MNTQVIPFFRNNIKQIKFRKKISKQLWNLRGRSNFTEIHSILDVNCVDICIICVFKIAVFL